MSFAIFNGLFFQEMMDGPLGLFSLPVILSSC